MHKCIYVWILHQRYFCRIFTWFFNYISRGRPASYNNAIETVGRRIFNSSLPAGFFNDLFYSVLRCCPDVNVRNSLWNISFSRLLFSTTVRQKFGRAFNSVNNPNINVDIVVEDWSSIEHLFQDRIRNHVINHLKRVEFWLQTFFHIWFHTIESSLRSLKFATNLFYFDRFVF